MIFELKCSVESQKLKEERGKWHIIWFVLYRILMFTSIFFPLNLARLLNKFENKGSSYVCLEINNLCIYPSPNCSWIAQLSRFIYSPCLFIALGIECLDCIVVHELEHLLPIQLKSLILVPQIFSKRWQFSHFINFHN